MQRSFDHLIGAVEQRRWHLQPDRLCRPQIDDELEFVRLLDRDVGGLGAELRRLGDVSGVGPGNTETTVKFLASMKPALPSSSKKATHCGAWRGVPADIPRR